MLRSRLSIPPPRLASRTVVPAAATAALLALAALQIGWTRPIGLPPPDAITPLRLDAVATPAVAMPPTGDRGLFSSGAGGDAPVQPLGGASAVGVVSRSGHAIAFVQGPDARITSLTLGQAYAGWQLVGIGADGLRFRRGGETATLPIGRGPGAAAGTPPVAGQAPTPQ